MKPWHEFWIDYHIRHIKVKDESDKHFRKYLNHLYKVQS